MRREGDTDYVTREGLARAIAGEFWSQIEKIVRWARWAAPCPIPPADLRGFGARRRRINERTADRVRQRQPLLPALVAHVEEHYSGRRVLFEAVRQAGPVEADELAGFARTVATGRCTAVVPPQPAGH